MRGIARARARLLQLATETHSLPELRGRVVQVVADLVPHDAVLFHEASPRVPLERGYFAGLDLGVLAVGRSQWDHNAVALGRLRDLALQRGGVAGDIDAFPVGSRGRAQWTQRVARPFGIDTGAFVHLVLRDRVIAVLALFRRHRRNFTTKEFDLLRSLVTTLSVVDGLAQSLESGPPRGVATKLQCVDQRLTPAQRKIVTHVALGHTNAQIARALELSPNTVRNQLAQTFQRLDAANRADLVRLAVLR